MWEGEDFPGRHQQQHVREMPHSWLFPGEAAPRTPESGGGGESEVPGNPETPTEAALVDSVSPQVIQDVKKDGKVVGRGAAAAQKDSGITRHHHPEQTCP